ncbi:MAG: HAMP domain-containing protein [Alphaproteobacteria bacterium]|nr:HAMP domain-containing protein [Alphaproteobacteria bacterium]
MKLAPKILAPIVILALVTITLIAVAVNAQRNVHDSTDLALAAGRQLTHASEIRALSRAIQRDTLNMILEDDASARQQFDQSIVRRSAEMRERVGQLVRSLSGPDVARLANFTALQAAVLTEVDRTKAHVLQGQRDEALQALRNGIRPREREASTITDAFITDKAQEVDQLDAAADATSRRAFLTLIITSVVGIGTAMGFGLLIVFRGVIGPIRRTIGLVEDLSKGNLDVAIGGTDRKDEIGLLARAFVVFKDGMVKARELAAREMEQIRQREQRAQRLEQLTNDFDTGVTAMLQTVAAAATQLRGSATALTSTAEEGTRRASTVASASVEASTNVQAVASAAEELATSVNEISRQVATSSATSGEAVEQAKQTNAKVEALSAAATKIGDVLKMISDIAGQTNLLALNATIEAARAGEAGKGFAIVASEVKSLANQTAKATEEIAAQIAAIQAATQDSVQAIQGIGGTISTISEISTAIAAAVEEQDAATKEIARNIQQAAAGSAEVSANVDGISSAAHETNSAAGDVLSASAELSRQAEMLRTQVDTFLAGVRAA